MVGQTIFKVIMSISKTLIIIIIIIGQILIAKIKVILNKIKMIYAFVDLWSLIINIIINNFNKPSFKCLNRYNNGNNC